MTQRQMLLSKISVLVGIDIKMRMFRDRSLERLGPTLAWPIRISVGAGLWLSRMCGRTLTRRVLWLDQSEIPEDEFHPSLDMNGLLTTWMTREELEAYLRDLVRRRDIAHKRDLARTG